MKPKKKILFVCYGGGHVNMVIPVVRKLKAQGDFDVQILGLTIAGPVLEREGLPYLGYRDLLEVSDERSRRWGETLLERFGNNPVVAREESVAYLGLSYTELENRLGEAEAARLLDEKGRHAFLQLGVLEKLLIKMKPDVVVATNSPKSEKAAILSARKLGIPAVCIVDLFDSREFDDRLGKAGYADRLCVLSDHVKSLLMEYGRKDDEVVATGNPAFDLLADPTLEAQARALRQARGWDGKKVILWASSIAPYELEVSADSERELIRVVGRNAADMHLVIRPHPNEHRDYKELPEWVSYSKPQERLSPLLKAVDLVATTGSTVGLEGALLKKPVLQMLMANEAAFCSYTDLGVAVGVRNLSEVESGIQAALSPSFRPKPLPSVGGAAGKIADVISALAVSRRPEVTV